ncbi:hypothetical protein OQA88_6554 [Cercophora sp. LCS_1]
MDQLQPNPPIDIHTPFTTAERIQQLSEIDKDIALLLQQTSSALRAIANPPAPTPPPTFNFGGSPPSDDGDSGEASLANFKAIQSDFLNTLDRIDKHLKRHIYALEEAGIITLRNAGEAAPGTEAGGATAGTGAAGAAGAEGNTGRAKEIVARLEPDGIGRYGSLDVGQLNMASSTVERDMERELWATTTARLTGAELGGVDMSEMMQE